MRIGQRRERSGRRKSTGTHFPHLEPLESRQLLTVATGAVDDGVTAEVVSSKAATLAMIDSGPFRLYDSVNQPGKPDLVGQHGWSAIQIVWTGMLWGPRDDMSEPNLARVRQIARQLDPGQLVVLDIEHWPTQGPLAGDSIRKLIEVVETMREENPELVLGYYAMVPIQEYWDVVNYDFDPHRFHGPYQEWVDANARLAELAEHLDVIFPSIYTVMPDYAEDGSPRLSERARWVMYATQNIEQARQYGKPVIPFISPIYWAGGAPYYWNFKPMSQEFWRLVLDTTSQLAPGAVVYTSQTVNGRWDHPAWWDETVTFMEQMQVPEPEAAPPEPAAETPPEPETTTPPPATTGGTEITAIQTSATTLRVAQPGDVVTLTASFQAGLAANHSYRAFVDWGDGSPLEPATIQPDEGQDADNARVAATHAFALAGMHTVTLTIDDGHGGVGQAQTSAIVSGVALTGGVLQVIGTESMDRVFIEDGNSPTSKVEVSTSFLSRAQKYDVADIDRIEVHSFGGRDKVYITHPMAVPTRVDGGDDVDELYAGAGPTTLLGGPGDDSLVGGDGDDLLDGGAGNDRLDAGDGHDILIGGEGMDFLSGGTGDDLLIGGLGADLLGGERGDDILIGGTTAYDQVYAALLAILAEWTSARDYDQRVANIRNSTGPILAGSTYRLVVGETVLDDGEDERDVSGSSGQNWFLIGPRETSDR